MPRPGRCASRALSLSLIVAAVAGCSLRRDAAKKGSLDPNRIALASPNAFDLVADAAGLTLVFAPERGSDALATLVIDADGFSSAVSEPLAPRPTIAGRIGELHALRSDGALIAAFAEGVGARASLKAIWKRGAERVTPIALGPAHTAAGATYGEIALAAAKGEALVFARSEALPCASDPRQICAGFRIQRVRDGKPDNIGLPLAVPAPCDAASLLVALSPSRWRYGVCSRQGEKTSTTLFTIERSPDYASAESLLPGCVPRALSIWGERTLLVGDCSGARSVIELRDGAAPSPPKELAPPKINCPAGIARVLLAGELELTQPRAGLEALLPESMAAPRARAAWAGRALVVASPTPQGVSLTRYACNAGIFSAERVRPRAAQ